jgi:hypothetical protein
MHKVINREDTCIPVLAAFEATLSYCSTTEDTGFALSGASSGLEKKRMHEADMV